MNAKAREKSPREIAEVHIESPPARAGLFAERSSEGGSTARHDSMNVGVLLHHMETFGGVVVAITNRYSALCLSSIRSFSRG